MENFDPIDVTFLLNSAEVKQESKVIREEITGVSVTAESVAKKTSKIVADELQKVGKEYEKLGDQSAKSAEKASNGISNRIAKLLELENEIQRLQQAEKNLANEYDRGVISQQDFARSAVELREKLLQTKQELKSVTAEIASQGKTIPGQKAQWNGLGNSIQQISRELPAFTYSAQTGFMAVSNNIPILVDEINRLKVANAAAAASGAATIPVWTAIKTAIFSWGTAISLIITLFTFFGGKAIDFIKSLFDTKKALDDVKVSQEAMSEAFKSSAVEDAVSDMTDLKQKLDLAKQGLIDQKTVIDQYNESIGKSTKEVNSLQEAEAGIVAYADKYIQATLAKAAADAAREKGVKDQIELMNQQLEAERKLEEAVKNENESKDFDFDPGRGVQSAAQRAKLERMAAERELKEITKQLDDSIAQTERTIEAFMKKSLGAGVNLFGDESQFNKITKGIKEIKEAYATAGMESAEKEVETVKAKFAKLRAEAQKFNADPANQANIIDLSGLDAAEQKALEAIRAKQQKSVTGKVTKEHEQLLDKIAALDAEYARKSFTKDEEEIQALRDKFARVRELVERFNADPKNKAQRIDLAGLDATEAGAIGDLKFRQETAVMAKELTEQKRLFQEYEQYKVQFGEAKAKERYGKELKGYETYLDYLKEMKSKADQEADIAAATGQGGGPQGERADLFGKALTDEVMRTEKQYQDLLAASQTFQATMLKRTEEFNANYARLLADGKTAEAAVYKEKFEAEDKALNLANLKKTEAYKALYSNIRNLTIRNVKALFVAMDEEVAKTELTAEQLEEIERRKADVRRQLYGQIMQLAGALGNLGQSLTELGSSVDSGGLSQIGGLMSGLASGVGDLLTAIDKDASKVDVITAGISGVVKMVSMLAGAAKRRRDAEEEYYRSVIGYQHEYNLSLNEQIRLQSKLQESVFLSDYEGRMKDGFAALKDANEEYQAALAALSGGKAKSGQKNAVDWGNVGVGAGAGAATGAAVGTLIMPVVGTAIGAIVGGIGGALAGLFGGKKKKDTYVPLLQEYGNLIQVGEDGIERLNRELAETLIANNLVDEATKDILQNIMDWEDALEEARQQIRDVVSELAGSLGDDMRNALVQAFRDGEDAAIAMGDTVEQVLENILSQMIFQRIFSDAFKQLEDEMVASQDVGGDGNWVDDFERFFQASKGLGEQWEQAMKDAQAQAAASGFNIFDPTGSTPEQKGLTGSIERITSEQASELSGLARSTFDLSKRHLQLDEGRMALEQKHYENSLNSYRALAVIEQNTANTVTQLQLAVGELKEIRKNTVDGGGFRDSGRD